MALVRCEILDGPRPGFKTVGIPSIEGHSEYLSIEARFLAKREAAYLLPVFVVGKDQQHGTALIQLPLEADSGARRVWVKSDILVNETDEVYA